LAYDEIKARYPSSCSASLAFVGYGSFQEPEVQDSQWVGVLRAVCDCKEEIVMVVGVEKLLAVGHVTSCLPAIKRVQPCKTTAR